MSGHWCETQHSNEKLFRLYKNNCPSTKQQHNHIANTTQQRHPLNHALHKTHTHTHTHTFECSCSLSTAERTQPILPSPPNTITLNLSRRWNNFSLKTSKKRRDTRSDNNPVIYEHYKGKIHTGCLFLDGDLRLCTEPHTHTFDTSTMWNLTLGFGTAKPVPRHIQVAIRSENAQTSMRTAVCVYL